MTATDTFVLTVTAVNDAPSFTTGANQTGASNSGARTVAGWATAISDGPADEASQTESFLVTNNNAALFSVQPAVAGERHADLHAERSVQRCRHGVGAGAGQRWDRQRRRQHQCGPDLHHHDDRHDAEAGDHLRDPVDDQRRQLGRDHDPASDGRWCGADGGEPDGDPGDVAGRWRHLPQRVRTHLIATVTILAGQSTATFQFRPSSGGQQAHGELQRRRWLQLDEPDCDRPVSPQWNEHVEALAAEGVGKQRRADRPGRRVRAIRAERNLSRADVARASGFSIREVAKIERNGDRLVFEDWRALAGALGVDVAELAPRGMKPVAWSEDPLAEDDDVPLDLVDLELDEFIARVHGDNSGSDTVMNAALAELDTGATLRPVIRRSRYGHRRGTMRPSRELRLRLTVLDHLCTQFVVTNSHDSTSALVAEIVTAVERVQACREFGEVAIAQPQQPS